MIAYTQDGERQAEDMWYVNVYDDYGRVIYEGLEDDDPGSNNSFNNAAIQDTLITMVYGTSGVEIDKVVTQSNKLLTN